MVGTIDVKAPTNPPPQAVIRTPMILTLVTATFHRHKADPFHAEAGVPRVDPCLAVTDTQRVQGGTPRRQRKEDTTDIIAVIIEAALLAVTMPVKWWNY